MKEIKRYRLRLSQRSSLSPFLRNLFYFPRPRALAVGERLWSSKETTNLADATVRLWEHRCRYVRYDVITQNYFFKKDTSNQYLGTESVPCRLLLWMVKYGHGLKLDKVLLLCLHKSPKLLFGLVLLDENCLIASS